MLVSLAAALLAALCYGIAAVMQAIAVRAASRRAARGVDEPGRVDPGLVIRMLRQWPFLVSLAIDLFGFLCQLIALRRLPLFEVQVIIAANLAVTAVLASWLMHAVLAVREWLAVAAVVVGIGMLGSSSGGQGAAAPGPRFQVALIGALGVIALAGFAAARLPDRARTPVLGAIAGLGYGVLAVCARILPGFGPHELIRSPAAYTLAAAGVISFVLYAAALESGSVTVATASVILFETIPPAIVGVLLLGDTTRPGMAEIAASGFAIALLSAIALARFGEAGTREARPQPALRPQPEPRPEAAPRPQPEPWQQPQSSRNQPWHDRQPVRHAQQWPEPQSWQEPRPWPEPRPWQEVRPWREAVGWPGAPPWRESELWQHDQQLPQDQRWQGARSPQGASDQHDGRPWQEAEPEHRPMQGPWSAAYPDQPGLSTGRNTG